MAKFSRTWWGKRFIESLETFSDDGRLGRGRSYARNGKILDYKINNGKITATVKGSINPYFGVYKEPRYKVSIKIQAISTTNWTKIIQQMVSKASIVSKLLLNEVPDNIESCFNHSQLKLLPKNTNDFDTRCSCPDYANPCKHIAGVCYLIASELDKDPFLLFELRGLSRKQLQKELSKSPLGAMLFSITNQQEAKIVETKSYYTRPKTISAPESVDLKTFWNGTQTLDIIETSPPNIPAILVKTAGDFPPFWEKDTSFIEIMEEFYKKVRIKGLK
jgi:uncharacterized Zn finger protein